MILYIHLYRRRFPPREIAGLFLWLSPRQKAPSGTKRERIPITLSLLLELLAAAVLALLLADPRARISETLRHLVFVLDNSASMAARDAGGQSSAERAVAFVKDQLARDLRAKATLILTGPRVAILGRTESAAAEATGSLASYRPSLPDHSPAEALALALDLAGAAGEVHFLSDHLPPERERHKQVTYLAVGSPADNAGFVGADWVPARSAAKEEIFLCVANFSTRPRTVTLTGRVGGQTVLEKRLDIAPGSRERIVWKAPDKVDALTFDLPADALDLDNHLVLVRPPRRVVAIANLLPQDPAREHLARGLAALSDVQLLTSAEGAHLTLAPADGFSRPAEGSWWLVVGPFSGAYRAPGDPKNLVGPFLSERTHPLMDGVTLEGVIWAGAAPAKEGVTPIVSGGDIPLVAALASESARVYWLNLDLARSNLARSPDWPILLANLVELRRAALPGLARRSFRVGEDVQCVRPDPTAALTVTGPGGFRRELPPAPDLYLSRLSTPGVYRVEAEGKLTELFALNLLDDAESDLRGLGRGRVEGELPAVAQQLSLGQRPGWLVFVLAGLALAAVLGNWWLNRGTPRAE